MTVGRVVVHDRGPPSSGYRYAALAASIELLSLPEESTLRAIIPAKADPRDDVHDCQHVTADGALVPNGVIWLERAGAAVVLDPKAETASLHLGKGMAIHAEATWSGRNSFSIDFDHPSAVRSTFVLDDYGRPTLSKTSGGAARPESVGEPTRSIAVLADPHRATWIYPAVRAALGDAADASGCRLAIELVPPPARPADAGDPARWWEFDGVVLPGGADMDRTSALVEAAAACRSGNVPTLGLCLGMQAMCIAGAWDVPRLRGAAMEEIEPGAPLLLFTRLPASDGCPPRRLGDHDVTVASTSRLAERLAGIGAASTWSERMNHSYRLEPGLLSIFAESGLSVISLDSASKVVDIVEDPARTFYVGSEGHPELRSRRGAPHPIIHSFLASTFS